MQVDAVKHVECRPNFSAAGRRRRLKVARLGLVAAAAAILLSLFMELPLLVRLLVFFPVTGAAVARFQVRRLTCVHHAAAGTIEDDNFLATPADREAARASRSVALAILRDALLIGIAAAAFAAIAHLTF